MRRAGSPGSWWKHGLAVVEFQMLVEPDARGYLGEDRRERGLVDHERIAPQVVPIQLDQVKGIHLGQAERRSSEDVELGETTFGQEARL